MPHPREQLADLEVVEKGGVVIKKNLPTSGRQVCGGVSFDDTGWYQVNLLRSQDLKVQHAQVVGLASVECLLEVVGLINTQGTDTLSAYNM